VITPRTVITKEATPASKPDLAMVSNQGPNVPIPAYGSTITQTRCGRLLLFA
jgi:hypothetical protein